MHKTMLLTQNDEWQANTSVNLFDSMGLLWLELPLLWIPLEMELIL